MNKYQFLGLWSTTSIGGGVGGYYYGSAGGAEEGLSPVRPQEEWQKWWNDIVKNGYKQKAEDRRKLEYDLGRCSRSFWKFGSLTDKRTLIRRKENSISSTWKGCAHIDLRTAEFSNNHRVLVGRWEIVVRSGDKGIILGGLVTPDYDTENKLAFRGWIMEMKRTNGWWNLESIKGWIDQFEFLHADKEGKSPTGFGTNENQDKNKGLIFGKGWIKDSPWDDGHDRLIRAYNVCKLDNTTSSTNPAPIVCPTYETKGLPFDMLKVNNTVFWTTEDKGKNAQPLKDLLKIQIAKGDGTVKQDEKIKLWSKLDSDNEIEISDKWDYEKEWQSISNNEKVKMEDWKSILGLDKKYKLENLVW